MWPLLQVGVENLLDALPDEVLELIMAYYLASRRADEKRNASAHLQACLRRHLTQRCEVPCEDPTHAGFVTYTRSKMPCYAATHAHPQRITCRASRQEYFLRAFTNYSPGLGERSEIAWLSARVTQCVTDVRGVNEASYEVMTGVSRERSERWQLWL